MPLISHCGPGDSTVTWWAFDSLWCLRSTATSKRNTGNKTASRQLDPPSFFLPVQLDPIAQFGNYGNLNLFRPLSVITEDCARLPKTQAIWRLQKMNTAYLNRMWYLVLFGSLNQRLAARFMQIAGNLDNMAYHILQCWEYIICTDTWNPTFVFNSADNLQKQQLIRFQWKEHPNCIRPFFFR